MAAVASFTALAFVLSSGIGAATEAEVPETTEPAATPQTPTTPTTPTLAPAAQPQATAPAASSDEAAVETSAPAPPLPSLSADERYIDALARTFLGRSAVEDELVEAASGLDDARRAALARVAVAESDWADDHALSGYGSSEAHARADDDRAFVDGLYRAVFGRAGDDSGVEYWTGRLADGEAPEAVAAAFASTDDARAARVDQVFRSVLDRAPDAAGAAFWAERLGEVDETEMAVQLAAGGEFYDRAVAEDHTD